MRAMCAGKFDTDADKYINIIVSDLTRAESFLDRKLGEGITLARVSQEASISRHRHEAAGTNLLQTRLQ